MTGEILGFILWALCGAALCALGIYAFFAKKPMGFWANAEVFEVTDLRGYNAAVGALFIGYGFFFILLGLPLLSGQNSGWILLSVLGVMLLTIGMMAVYTLVIEKKYKKK